MRLALLGADPEPVRLTRRATAGLARLRDRAVHLVDADRTVVVHHDDDRQVRWWTWAGGRANALLAAALARVRPDLVDDRERLDNRYLHLPAGATARGVATALADARREYGADLAGIQPEVDERAVRQLKFADLLPPELARATLAARSADHEAAARVLERGVVDSGR